MSIILSIIIILCSVSLSFALPAFPGAEGMGASATGARGYSGAKSVCKVTNTNDTGAGSLRNCIAGTGKEGTFVVFDTSGTIDLQSPLSVLSDYVTIAGQTSPGGIAVAGDEFSIGNNDTYNVNDVIITHMRFREGSHNCAPDCDATHSFAIWKSNNIIVDHSSFSWGIDETVTATTYNNASAYNITFSWSIIGEGLTDPAPESNHGYGFLFNGGYFNTPANSITFHHNYFLSSNARLPQFSGDLLADFRNNVIYNWDASQNTMLIPQAGKTLQINYVGNYTKPGPDSNACDPAGNSFEATAQDGGAASGCPDNGAITPYAMLYMSGNFGCTRDDAGDAEWALGCGWSGNAMSTNWRSNSAFETGDIAVSTTAMTAAYALTILETVGANKPSRDSADTDMVNDYINNTGALKADTTWPTDWPTFSNPAAPTDSDNDGMSDTWETSTFGDLTQTLSGDYDSDGYLNIEEYFHYLGGYSVGDVTAPTVTSASVNSSTVTITFDETVVTTGYDAADFNIDCVTAGTDISLTSPSGSGASRTFTAATPVAYGDTCNLDYVGSTDDIEDTSGNDLATFSNTAVTNNTAQAQSHNGCITVGGYRFAVGGLMLLVQ